MTTGQSGFMQASAANGFMNTSIIDCSGTPFNFEPEYNTAGRNEINPVGCRSGRHQHGVRDRTLGVVHIAAQSVHVPDVRRGVPRRDRQGLPDLRRSV